MNKVHIPPNERSTRPGCGLRRSRKRSLSMFMSMITASLSLYRQQSKEGREGRMFDQHLSGIARLGLRLSKTGNLE